jgi:hypothetical protein
VPPGRTVFSYDAAVHAIAIGFVLSMVFGHAPIILPAVTGIRVRVTAAAYVPLGLLHLSLLLRVAADFCDWVELRATSGPLTVVALMAYAGVLIAAWRRRPTQQSRLPHRSTPAGDDDARGASRSVRRGSVRPP